MVFHSPFDVRVEENQVTRHYTEISQYFVGNSAIRLISIHFEVIFIFTPDINRYVYIYYYEKSTGTIEYMYQTHMFHLNYVCMMCHIFISMILYVRFIVHATPYLISVTCTIPIFVEILFDRRREYCL